MTKSPLEHNPRVSILMAAYNAERWVAQAIESVLAQTVPEWQLICVDDASTDGTPSLLQHYAEEDQRIIVLQQSANQGQAVARNEALRLATGEYVVMLDADDWLSADCVEQIVAAFDSEESIDSVVLKLMMYHEDSDGRLLRQEPYPTPFDTSAPLSGYDAFVLSLDWQLHGLYAVRREIHERYPYDTSCHLYSDDNTTRLHYLHSRRVAFCNGVYYYRQHEKSCTTAITPDRFLYMKANLSMSNTLREEGLDKEILDLYERHRWENYIGQHRLYYLHSQRFVTADRRQIESMLRKTYHTFAPSLTPWKFGHRHLLSYRLFLVQEWVYFSLRRLFRRG